MIDHVSEMVMLGEKAGLKDGVPVGHVGVSVTDGERLIEGVPLADALSESVGCTVGVLVREGLRDRLRLGEGVRVQERLEVPVVEGVRVPRDAVRDPSGDGDQLADSEWLTEEVRVHDGRDGVGVNDAELKERDPPEQETEEALGDTLRVDVHEAERVPVNDCDVCDWVRLDVRVGVRVGVCEGWCVSERVEDRVAVWVGDRDGERDWLPVEVEVYEGRAVGVKLWLVEHDALNEPVPLPVAVGPVRVGSGVEVTLRVGVKESDWVGEEEHE